MAFVTGAFPGPDHFVDTRIGNWREKKSWLAVLHRFDGDGNHLSTEVRVGGPDSEGHQVAIAKATEHLADLLREHGIEQLNLGDIYIKPFSVEIGGIFFELKYSQSEHEGRRFESVTLWPNDIMFHPPWHSGEYST